MSALVLVCVAEAAAHHDMKRLIGIGIALAYKM